MGVRVNVKLKQFCKKSPSGFLFVVFVSLQSAYENELHSLLMTNLMYPSSQGAKWCQALAFYFNRIKMESVQVDYCLWVLQNMSKHIQCHLILYSMKDNQKTILLYLYSKPTKDPILYPGAPPAVPMSQIMYHNVCSMY